MVGRALSSSCSIGTLHNLVRFFRPGPFQDRWFALALMWSRLGRQRPFCNRSNVCATGFRTNWRITFRGSCVYAKWQLFSLKSWHLVDFPTALRYVFQHVSINKAMPWPFAYEQKKMLTSHDFIAGGPAARGPVRGYQIRIVTYGRCSSLIQFGQPGRYIRWRPPGSTQT